MKLLKAIGAGALTFLFMYLMGAFISASFDILTWSAETRILVGMLGGAVSFMAAMFVLSEGL